MRKLAATFLLSLLFAFAQNQPAIRITFVLTSPNLPDDTAVYITGSVEQLSSWNPGKVKMDSRGNHTWTKEITVNSPLSIEYKYTLGTWEREGAQPDGSPLSNFFVDASQDKTVEDTVLFWTNGPRQRVNHGQITGTVRYHRGLKGAGLLDRDLIVWLPPGYETDRTRRYPVVYMHDGQNIIDPVYVCFWCGLVDR